MNLNLNPENKNWPLTHFICVEKTGEFMETAPKSWQELHQKTAKIIENGNKIIGYMSLYKIQPSMIYCAGVILEKAPKMMIEGMKYIHFQGGKYSCFTLQGSYAQLPEACGLVFKQAEKLALPMRDDYFIEHYLNSPETTPEDQLLTEILIPTK